MPNYKLQSPLVINNNGIYPLTTVDQVILDDNSRLNSKMVTIDLNTENDEVTKLPTRDADTLGGIPANKYALKDNLAVIDNYITTMTAEDFEALTIEQKAELYSQGVRIITVDRDLDSDNLSDMQRFAQFVYPVGSIVELTVATNPATLWGFGTWESYMSGRVLIGAGTADSGTVYTAGNVGGEETHVLTVSEMPSHNHATYGQVPVINAELTDSEWGHPENNPSWHFSKCADSTQSAGGSQPHNNLPPYGVIYRWHRTA